MKFEITKSIISFFNEWNGLNIFIAILSLTNFLIITYQSIKNKYSIKSIFKIKSVNQVITSLAILTILIIIFIFPTFFKYAVFLTFCYYFYCIYIVPIFDIKDNFYASNIPEHFLIIISGFYYYFSIILSLTINSNFASLNTNSAQIIYTFSLLVISFTFTYCMFLNIYYILKFAVTYLMDNISNINIKKESGDSFLLGLENEKKIYFKIGKILFCYLSYVILFFIGLFVIILIFPYYMVRNVKNIAINKILSIIAKFSIIFSLIMVYITMKTDGTYSELFTSIYETLISVIIIPLVLEGLLSIKRNLN